MSCRRRCTRSRIAAAIRSRCGPNSPRASARAYLTEGWQQYAPLKLATSGAVFRYERPQKGRYRQFHQIDAEVIGAAEPAADVELLVLADQLLRELGIAEGVTLQLNTLGDAETRDAWRAALVAHFEAHRGELSRGQPDPARQEPDAHPRQQGPARPPDRRRGARHRRVSDERGGRVLRGGDRRGSMRRAWRGRATRGWCAGSIITATPRSSSSPTGSARRARCWRAGAMTG